VVANDQRSSASTKVEQMRAEGRVEFDLTSPPSRAEAGLPEGSREVVYELLDRGPFQVRVLLPEQRELDFPVRLAVFDTMDAPDPRTGPPTTLDLHHYPGSLAAGRDHLLAAAAEFGIDPAPIHQWYDTASQGPPAQGPSTVRTLWLSTRVGYLQLEIQGRYAPPVDTPESDQTVIHYSLTWQVDGADRG